MNKFDAAWRIVRQRLLGLALFFGLWLVFMGFIGMLNLWTGLLSFVIVFSAAFFGAFMRVNKNERTSKKK